MGKLLKRLIWVICMIWRNRNEKAFNNMLKEVDELLDEVKMMSWR